MKAVLDTNIWVSGFVFGGEIRKVLEAAIEEQFQPVISPALLNELERVLQTRKIGYTPTVALATLHQVQLLCLVVHPAQKLHLIAQDPSDNMVLECAMEAKADFIVSGDRHLLQLKEFHSIPILTARQFVGVIP